MSGPPGVGILNRSPYMGTPNVTAGAANYKDGGLPSGTAKASFRNDQYEQMTNSTANHPFFVCPVSYPNEILENDILFVRTSGVGEKYTNLSTDYGMMARPLRLLAQTPEFFIDKDTGFEKIYDSLEAAKEEARRWRCLGVVVAVGARSDNDRQVVNVAIRGRIGVPNIFRNTKKIRTFPNGDNLLRPRLRGDLFAIKIAAEADNESTSNEFVLTVDTVALKSAVDVPRLEGLEQSVQYHVLGTYIRNLASANASDRSIRDYLNGDKSILDRKATFEVSLRL